MERSIKEAYGRFVNPSIVKLLEWMAIDHVEMRSEGCYIYDEAGRQYIDCLGGYGALAFGHRPPRIIDAVKRQLDIMPLSGKVFLNPYVAKVSAHLAEITPQNLQYSFWANSGTEAVEGALKTARLATGRTRFVAMAGGFHGKSFGALSVSGRRLYQDPFAPLLADVIHVPFGDAEALAQVMDHTVAAVILEPIQGEGGIQLPPAGYLRKVRDICNAYGSLMIVDEVQTGMGRTGRRFAVEWELVCPDILVLAKALGGGVMPCGAFIATEQVWKPYFAYPFLHTSTFGGNPLACVAADMAMTVLEEEGLSQNAENIGRYILSRLKEWKEAYPNFIREVRGRGMMIGIEMMNESAAGMLMQELLARGVIVAYTLNNPVIIRIEPPLIMERSIANTVLERLGDAICQVMKMGI